MNVSTRYGAVCLIALMTLLAQGVQAQTAKAQKAPKASTYHADRWTRHALLMGPTVICEAGQAPCEVPVTMSQGMVDGVRVCLARMAGEIKVPEGASGRMKNIVWSLNPPTLPGVELFFQPEHGILVVDDRNQQLKAMGHGASATQFVVRNKRSKRGESIYLPVILQRDTASNEVSVCAAADPKVVND